jgi:hypothetical protein
MNFVNLVVWLNIIGKQMNFISLVVRLTRIEIERIYNKNGQIKSKRARGSIIKMFVLPYTTISLFVHGNFKKRSKWVIIFFPLK